MRQTSGSKVSRPNLMYVHHGGRILRWAWKAQPSNLSRGLSQKAEG